MIRILQIINALCFRVILADLSHSFFRFILSLFILYLIDETPWGP